MKAPEKLSFAFDPSESDIPALASRVGRILWGCIKQQHITDQYFNDHVLGVVDKIGENNPTTYREFKNIIQHSGLQGYGCCRDDGSLGVPAHQRLDDDFWDGVWLYVSGAAGIKMVLEVEIESIKESVL